MKVRCKYIWRGQGCVSKRTNVPELQRILRVHIDQSKVLACCLKNDVELSRNWSGNSFIAVGQFISPGYTIKLTGKCSVFLKVFRERSNYHVTIKRRLIKPLANFTFLRIHYAEENLRKYVFNWDQVQENEGVMCPWPAIRHIFRLNSYSTKRHCFKRNIFLCKVFTTLKLRKFNIVNFFF